LFDLADSLSPDALGRCTDEALRRSIVNLSELRRQLDIHGGPGRRRLGPLKVVLAERVPGFDPGANRWEHRMDQLWDRLGLPRAERQYRITVGNRRYVLDRAVPELRLAVEWTGVGYHGQLSRYRRDRTRISDLVQIGWDVLEVTPDWTPERVRNTVWAKVAERQLIVGVTAG
jgi:very-short-patch-repair endonuclease